MDSKTLIITQYVLEAISNSYEELQMVVDEVSKWATEEEVQVTQDDVVAAISWLVAGGYAKAYEEHEGPSGVREADYSCELAERFYYFVTPKGKAVAQWLKDTVASSG